MTKEDLRILILRILSAVGRVGATAKSLRAQIAVEDETVSARDVDESAQYLIDRDFVRAKKSKLSGEIRLRIAPDGADLLEELDA